MTSHKVREQEKCFNLVRLLEQESDKQLFTGGKTIAQVTESYIGFKTRNKIKPL